MSGTTFIGVMDDGLLAALDPSELIEAYADASHTSWQHLDHKKRECSYDEWLRKWNTHVLTGCARSNIYLCCDM